MANVIDMLESLGQVPNFNKKNVQELIDISVADVEIKQAFLSKDNEKLNELMGVRNKIVCALLPAKDDEPAPQDDDGDEPKSDEIRRAV